MKKKISVLISYVIVAALASFLTLSLSEGFGGPSKLEQLERLILVRFIGEADREALEDAAADAMVTATGDRWSYYIPAAEYAAYQERMNNAYVGVGITIQEQTDKSGNRILSVTEGGPAAEAGLKAGDLLIAVEERDIRGMTTTEVRDLVRGKEGTFVSMTVLREGEEIVFSVERRLVQTQVAAGKLLPGNVGLVTIENFDKRCAQESIAVIEKLLDEGAQSLIFDVRNNPGGYASELTKLLDYLLPEGEIFHTEYYDGDEEFEYSDASCLDIPMAVLVNSNSYSAAEFFAAALQEYGAALVVGEQTVGKGYFQTTIRLKDGSAVSLSVGKYYTPKGNNLAGIGITPDKIIPVDEDTFAAIYYDQVQPMEDPQVLGAIAAVNN